MAAFQQMRHVYPELPPEESYKEMEEMEKAASKNNSSIQTLWMQFPRFHESQKWLCETLAKEEV